MTIVASIFKAVLTKRGGLQVEVVYESIPGWKTDITKMRSWDELPQAAKQYVARIEELIGVPCKWIGVGPGRDAIVEEPDHAFTASRR